MTYIYSSSKEIADSSWVIKAGGELQRSFLTSEEDRAHFNLLYILLVQHTHLNAYFYVGLEASLSFTQLVMGCVLILFCVWSLLPLLCLPMPETEQIGKPLNTLLVELEWVFFYCLVAGSCDEHKEFRFDWHDVLLKEKWSISIQAPSTCFFFRDRE